MAIFRKKPDDSSPKEEPQAFKPDPVKARKWFEHAKSMADSHQYASSLVYYANGLKFDPDSISAQENMLVVGQQHYKNGGKKISSKDIKQLDGPYPSDKLAMAMLAWTGELGKSALAMKALEAAIGCEKYSLASHLCPMILKLIQRAKGKKVTRAHLLQLMELAKTCGEWDIAIHSGRIAMNMDATDSKLDDEIKDIEASRAMDKGGYEKAAGKEGGFRELIKDADKQRELSQEDSLAGTGGSRESSLERAKHAYETSPDVPDVLNKYAQLLRREGSDKSLADAQSIYLKGYEDTGEYRFRMNAGDISINRCRSELAKFKHELSSASEADRPAMTERMDTKQAELLELEAEEYSDRTMKYPTDRGLKYQLGDVAFRRGDLPTAMECFQKAKDEPKLRTMSGHYLGKCFAQEQWHAEAIAEYKEVLESIDASNKELELEIRYNLMISLIAFARAEREAETAREALEICSWIARKDISYRDIRVRRKEIDELSREIS